MAVLKTNPDTLASPRNSSDNRSIPFKNKVCESPKDRLRIKKCKKVSPRQSSDRSENKVENNIEKKMDHKANIKNNIEHKRKKVKMKIETRKKEPKKIKSQNENKKEQKQVKSGQLSADARRLRQEIACVSPILNPNQPVLKNIWSQINAMLPYQRSSEEIYDKIGSYLRNCNVDIGSTKEQFDAIWKVIGHFPQIQSSLLQSIFTEDLELFLGLAHYLRALPSGEVQQISILGDTIHGIPIPPKPWKFQIGNECMIERPHSIYLFEQLALFALERGQELKLNSWKHIPFCDLPFIILMNTFFGPQVPVNREFVDALHVVKDSFSAFATQILQFIPCDQIFTVSIDRFQTGQLFGSISIPNDASGTSGLKDKVWMVIHDNHLCFVLFHPLKTTNYRPIIPSTKLEKAISELFAVKKLHTIGERVMETDTHIIMAFPFLDRIEGNTKLGYKSFPKATIKNFSLVQIWMCESYDLDVIVKNAQGMHPQKSIGRASTQIPAEKLEVVANNYPTGKTTVQYPTEGVANDLIILTQEQMAAHLFVGRIPKSGYLILCLKPEYKRIQNTGLLGYPVFFIK
jgi:hypothetical protein